MTIALVVSDTHGDLTLVREILASHPETAMVLHLGDSCTDAEVLRHELDIPVHGIRGNGDSDCPHGCLLETVLAVAGCRLLLCHGHRFDVKNGLSRLIAHAEAIQPPVDGVLFGHTHQPYKRIVRRPGRQALLVLNPGTARRNRFLNPSPASLALIHIEVGAGAEGIRIDWYER